MVDTYEVTMPAPTEQKMVDILEHAPTDIRALSGWLGALPFGQMEKVWVPLIVDAFHEEGSMLALTESIRTVQTRYHDALEGSFASSPLEREAEPPKLISERMPVELRLAPALADSPNVGDKFKLRDYVGRGAVTRAVAYMHSDWPQYSLRKEAIGKRRYQTWVAERIKL